MILIRGVTTSNTGGTVLGNWAVEHLDNDRPKVADSGVPAINLARVPQCWPPGMAVDQATRVKPTTAACGRWRATAGRIVQAVLLRAVVAAAARLVDSPSERFRLFAGSWVLALYLSLALLPAAFYRVAMKMGYLSDRHALLILCCGSYWTVAGLLWIGERGAAFPRTAGR